MGRIARGETDGEGAVKYALDKMGIEFEPEVIIPKLKGDKKDHRIADFYLPESDIYIEYLGCWNNKYDRYSILADT